ncbi:DUF1232 domain-containing protein [Emticicia sp. CRIBPO]|uniref:YkvA family protein n=1 Tax=Emticicia sp. CRIBPO TaxID=2683258 RepID=UPI001412714F|nr:YkvA family protein [Emticicia sp. CRIBPO]NBA84490.1 DUF1232 domain-containing protein [Emticicia sp. CRIBPO]
MSKASRISRNSQSLLQLLKNVLNKTQKMGVGGIFDEIRERLVVLGKLIKAYATGEYRDIELKNVVIIIASLVYFLSPIDLLPDIIPVLGFTDDVAFLTFIFRSLGDEIEKFEIWDLNNNKSV